MNFGHELKNLWHLENDLLFLNHGSFGATPKPILEAEWKWEEKMERDPMHFFLDEYPLLLTKVIRRLGNFMKADPRKIALIDNATSGVSTVLKSVMPDIMPGFKIVYTNHVYPAVKKIIEYVAKISSCKLIEINIPFPLTTNEEIMEYYRQGLPEGQGIVVLDHISFGPGVILPIKEMIDYSRSMGYMTLVDAAHTPGMLPLNIEELKPDWYVGNCHKWMYTPKGCAMLWADTHVQEQTIPLTISHGFGEGFAQSFGWTGTRNPAQWLAIGDALDFIDSFGHDNIYNYNHNLVTEGSKIVCDALGVKPALPGDMLGFLAPIEFSGDFKGIPLESHNLRNKLYREHNTEAVFNYLDGKMWLRISAQIYNDITDYVKLADIMKNFK
jgi:isopenicillin-N epimerase